MACKQCKRIHIFKGCDFIEEINVYNSALVVNWGNPTTGIPFQIIDMCIQNIDYGNIIGCRSLLDLLGKYEINSPEILQKIGTLRYCLLYQSKTIDPVVLPDVFKMADDIALRIVNALDKKLMEIKKPIKL